MSDKEYSSKSATSDSEADSDSDSSSSSSSSGSSSSSSSSSSSASRESGELRPTTPPLALSENVQNVDDTNSKAEDEPRVVDESVEPESKRKKLNEEVEETNTGNSVRSTTPPIENECQQTADPALKETCEMEKKNEKSDSSDHEHSAEEDKQRSEGEIEDNQENQTNGETSEKVEGEQNAGAESKESEEQKETTEKDESIEKPRSRSNENVEQKNKKDSSESKVDRSDRRDDRRSDRDKDRSHRDRDADRRRDRDTDRYNRNRYDDRRRRRSGDRSRRRSYSRSRSPNRSERRRKRRSRSTDRSKDDSKRNKDKDTNGKSKTDEKAPDAIPKAQQRTVDILTSKTGGAYIPPAKLRKLQAEITDKTSAAYQRIAWEALKKSIHGLINKVNIDNIGVITRELLKENIIRGRGLICRSIIQAQAASPTFTHVYAALVAVINSKFPNIGELLLHRLMIQFKRGFRRNDKAVCLSSTRFIAHLVNQKVAHEILALETLTLLVETPTDDSVEVAIAFMKECGMKLQEVSSKGVNAIFEMLKNILHEGKLEKRVQYMIEVVFQVRKDGFKDHVAVSESLELVEEDDQFTHLIMLDEANDTQDVLNVFKFDPEYAANEDKYKELSKELLGSDAENGSSESGSDNSSGSESDDEEDAEAEKKEQLIIDQTETNLIALRRTIYLTIHSSLDYEECAHKLMKMELKPGQEMELCHMFLDCCAEQRTYEKFYGLLAQRFCMINKIYIDPFEEIFRNTYTTTHRLDTNRLRNVSKFFAHLLISDAIKWNVLDCIRLNEDDTTSSSRIFIKILFQELAEYLGLGKLNARLKDPTLQVSFSGLFPRENPRDTRFAINFFTSIGLGGLTDELREHLKNAPKLMPVPTPAAVEKDNSGSGSSSSSSSDSSSSSSDSSDSSSNSSDSESSSSSDSSGASKKKKRTKKSKENGKVSNDRKKKKDKSRHEKSKKSDDDDEPNVKRDKESRNRGNNDSSKDKDEKKDRERERNRDQRDKHRRSVDRRRRSRSSSRSRRRDDSRDRNRRHDEKDRKSRRDDNDNDRKKPDRKDRSPERNGRHYDDSKKKSRRDDEKRSRDRDRKEKSRRSRDRSHRDRSVDRDRAKNREKRRDDDYKRTESKVSSERG